MSQMLVSVRSLPVPGLAPATTGGSLALGGTPGRAPGGAAVRAVTVPAARRRGA
ncbi:hypothetical protein [Streptomyces sp. NPDC088762]|uniref:hypothetical protein n=1 Tax=Streptomyces sp. NPDC088762 TaxID=3365891 RepID=UPI003808BFDE